jgi:hypothetical protein
MYQKTIVFLGIIGVALSLILGLLSVIMWQAVAILITVSLGIPSLILAYERFRSDVNSKPKEGKKEQEQMEMVKERVTLHEEEIVARPNNGYYYDLQLTKNDHLKGEIVSTEPVDIYFVYGINLDKWFRSKTFDYEDCNEDVLEAKIDYLAPKNGPWYLIIENNGRKIAKVKVHLY